MKTFLDLLATNFGIDIVMTVRPTQVSPVQVSINGKNIYDYEMNRATTFSYTVPLLTPVEIQVLHQGAVVDSLQFDGWEARPEHGSEHEGMWKFTTDGLAFYQWKHHATAQGWLLTPQ